MVSIDDCKDDCLAKRRHARRSDRDLWTNAFMRLTAIRGAVTLLSLLAATGVVAADLVAAIFFDAMRFDPDPPRALTSDRFVRSKGHAVPVLYAA
jgi:transketolase N-terminal domain/subunit